MKKKKCVRCGDSFSVKKSSTQELCDFCIKAEALAKEVNAPLASSVNSNPKIRVPLLEKLTSTADLKVGDFVYQKSDMFADDVSQRRFSREYKILKVKDNDIRVVVNMNRKVSYKVWDFTAPVTDFYVRVGHETVEEHAGPNFEE